MSLYLRLGAYLAAALLFMGAGWYLGGLAPKRALAQLQAQGYDQKAAATAAALAATQAQLKTQATVAAANAQTLEALQNENSKIAADRDANLALASRLLHAAPRPAPAGGGGVPEAQSGSSPAAAGPDPGNEQAAGLLADAAGECAANAAQLNALIAEITPQL